MDETEDHRTAVQCYFFDDKDIETNVAEGGLIHQTVFHAASGRKAGNSNVLFVLALHYYYLVCVCATV